MKNAIFMVLLAALCVALLTLAGCTQLLQKPIDRASDTMAALATPENIKAGAARLQEMQGQGAVGAVNPKLRLTVSGEFTQRVEASLEVGLDGVAGQIMGAASATPPVPRPDGGE